MTNRDESDIERIQQWAAFCSMPGEDNPTLEAIARQFPRMLAALRFVEARTELLGGALAFAEANAHNAETYNAELRDALRELAAFRAHALG